MLSGTVNFRQPVSKELLKVIIICIDTPFQSLLILIITMPCWHSGHISTKRWCGWQEFYACYAVCLPLMCKSDHSVNLQESHRKMALRDSISGYENLSSCSWEYWRQLIAEKWLWVFKVQWLHFAREVDKGKTAYLKFLQDFEYTKLLKLVHFWQRSYSRN